MSDTDSAPRSEAVLLPPGLIYPALPIGTPLLAPFPTGIRLPPLRRHLHGPPDMRVGRLVPAWVMVEQGRTGGPEPPEAGD